MEDWLGRQDSNLRSRDQNPMPYRLATPQHCALQGRAGRTIGARTKAGKYIADDSNSVHTLE